MTTYTIIGGINGAGKSSLTGVLRTERCDLGTVIDADILTAKAGGDKLKGGRTAVRLIDSCLEHMVNFTQETTLSGKKTLRTILAARERGYHIRLYYVGISSPEESLARIENRVRKGGHDIPPEVVKRRYESRNADLAGILPYCDEAHFYDNENGFVHVGEYRNGELAGLCSPLPGWLEEFENYLSGSY